MKLDSYAIAFGIMCFAPFILTWTFPEWSAFKIILVEKIFFIPIIIIALSEINKSKIITKQEKVKWTFAFILITLFTSIYYLLSERKNIIANNDRV